MAKIENILQQKNYRVKSGLLWKFPSQLGSSTITGYFLVYSWFLLSCLSGNELPVHLQTQICLLQVCDLYVRSFCFAEKPPDTGTNIAHP
jgi:hypothetical protein